MQIFNRDCNDGTTFSAFLCYYNETRARGGSFRAAVGEASYGVTSGSNWDIFWWLYQWGKNAPDSCWAESDEDFLKRVGGMTIKPGPKTGE